MVLPIATNGSYPMWAAKKRIAFQGWSTKKQVVAATSTHRQTIFLKAAQAVFPSNRFQTLYPGLIGLPTRAGGRLTSKTPGSAETRFLTNPQGDRPEHNFANELRLVGGNAVNHPDQRLELGGEKRREKQIDVRRLHLDHHCALYQTVRQQLQR